MLLTIAAATYCTLTYVAGYKLFNVSGKQYGPTDGSRIVWWLFSPITVPFGLFLLMFVG